jgi:K+ transporter
MMNRTSFRSEKTNNSMKIAKSASILPRPPTVTASQALISGAFSPTMKNERSPSPKQ